MSVSEGIIRAAEDRGWQEALSGALEGEEHERASHPERAAFVQLLPTPSGGRVLEIAAGWGGVTIELARASYRVRALEQDSDRARFIAIRARQEGVESLVEAAVGGFGDISGRFDAIVVHEPVLQAAGHLSKLRERLTSDGVIYIGGPIRRPWDVTGATYRRYVRVFADAGLRVRAAYASPRGFLNPSELVPLRTEAIRHYTRMRIEPAGSSLAAWMKNSAKTALASPGAWKLLAPAFVYFLEARDA